ncbi:amidohydrolase family protein [Brevibacillus ruminantium]|uniref:Amidohydrolase family protein n=1 Tax=Brevibacillus ruminantium TaxID=2950604 RepID=A0ABY4WC51_9BACL|nr:amidohydrolase family protein [Brevibacillus ruminantium]USG63497.1 amidohydrolase family protein [Brevibacillus ruminantium]
MTTEEIVIRNGTIVTASGVFERDIWVQDGVIRRIAKDRLGASRICKSEGKEWDASGMYIVPGFLTLPGKSPSPQRKLPDYLETVRKLVRFGYTSMSEIQPIDPWKNAAQRRYQTVIHYNSLIDYTFVAEVPASMMNKRITLQLCAEGYRIIRVVIRKLEDFTRIDWETISPFLTSYRVLLILHVPANAGFSKEEKQRISGLWLDRCRYWQIRTWVKTESELAAEETQSFYHLYQLDGLSCDLALRSMIHTPLRGLSVMAALDRVQVDARRLRGREEEVLRALVKLCSTNMAKALGLYPQKGSITPGADADLVFIKKEQWLTKFDLSTILKFSEFLLPTSVMSNGKWILQDDTFASTIGMGRWLRDIKPYRFVI